MGQATGEEMNSNDPRKNVFSHLSFQDPEYAGLCKAAISKLRTELHVYHDPKTPDIDDPMGIVNVAIGRLNELVRIALS